MVDAGNSAIKWCTWQTDAIDTVRVVVHRGVPEGLRGRLTRAWSGLPQLFAAHACSVAGARVEAEIESAVDALGVKITWWRSQPRFEGTFTLENGYRDPRQLGADRWHAMLGACYRVSSPVPSSLVI